MLSSPSLSTAQDELNYSIHLSLLTTSSQAASVDEGQRHHGSREHGHRGRQGECRGEVVRDDERMRARSVGAWLGGTMGLGVSYAAG